MRARHHVRTGALACGLAVSLVVGHGAQVSAGEIAVVQYRVQEQDTVGSDADRLAGFVREAAAHGARLVVCPETPFYRYAPYLQNGVTMLDLAQAAADLRARFAGLAAELGISLVVGIREPGGKATYNVACCFGPDGSLLGYHRKGLPSHAEDRYTLAGEGGAAIFDTPMGRVALAVCKDVQLRSVRASVVENDVDLFLLLAADADGRNLARIAEVCSAADCKGIIANQLVAYGNSAVASPSGEITYFGGGEHIFYTDSAFVPAELPPQLRGGSRRPIHRLHKVR